MHRRLRLARWVAILAHLLAAKSLDAAILYVDDSARAGGDGSSWKQAYQSLKVALNAAASGDEVRIGQGTYKPAGPNGLRTSAFKINDGVVVQGGYAGVGASNPDALKPSKFKTILSGDLQGNDGANFQNYEENSYHVVTCTNVGPTTELRGLYIQGGNADASFDSPHSRGGGVRCLGDVGLRLENCVIRRNSASLMGGGLFAPDGSPAFQSCKVIDNRAGSAASGNGGGAIVGGGTIDDCTFTNNSANEASASGGALVGESFILTNSTFEHNGSSAVLCGANSIILTCSFTENFGEDGGAITITGGNAAVIRCTFQSNSASSFGGAIYVKPDAVAAVLNCKFCGNAANIGNALTNRGWLAIANCLLSGNDHEFGSQTALYNLDGDLIVGNCTINHNKSEGLGGGVLSDSGAVVIRNSIVWANGSDVTEESQVFAHSGSLNLDFCCVQGWSGGLGGDGDFGSNPRFIDANGADDIFGTADDDAHLADRSPCRDAGDIASLAQDKLDLDEDGVTGEPLPLDLDFHNRVIGPGVDVGAFES